MVTKTLILRPIRVTCDDESLLTFSPDTTTIDNAHMLINEEVADDGSSYVSCQSPINISYHFDYIKPRDMKNILSFNIYTKNKLVVSNTVINTYTLSLSNDYTLATITNESTSVWVTDTITLDESDNTNIFNELNNISDICLTQNVTTSGNKASTIHVTQIYIEIVYEVSQSIHIKHDGVWDVTECEDFYIKDNNTWVKVDLPIENAFNNGAKYRVKESG